eukprot:scaffold219717_cov31-Tisochrysis_lutea.AAC.5
MLCGLSERETFGSPYLLHLGDTKADELLKLRARQHLCSRWQFPYEGAAWLIARLAEDQLSWRPKNTWREPGT